MKISQLSHAVQPSQPRSLRTPDRVHAEKNQTVVAQQASQLQFNPRFQARGPQATLTSLAPLFSLEQNIDAAWQAEAAKINHIGPRLHELPDFAVTPLRIALDTEQVQAQFSVEAAQILVQTPQGPIDLGWHSGEFEVQALSGGFELFQAGQSLGQFQGTLQVQNQTETLKINGQAYRGSLELSPAPARPERLQVINSVLLEDYLLAVVPSESPASWPIESLKAQSYAARTYAVANWGKNKAHGFDMHDNTSDQVYNGIASEHPRTNEAVKATQGQILVHQNRPITALFFSSSGGHTDSSLEVWGTDLPYIQPVPDFDQASSRYRWTLNRSASTLTQAAQKLGHDLGTIHKIEPLEHTPQGRVKTLRLSGTQGSAEVNANRFRFAAGLYSTLWQVERQGSGPNAQFAFKGGGWGHGLGMSQWGARQLAADGWSGEQIVKHYYTGVELKQLEAQSTAPSVS